MPLRLLSFTATRNQFKTAICHQAPEPAKGIVGMGDCIDSDRLIRKPDTTFGMRDIRDEIEIRAQELGIHDIGHEIPHVLAELFF